MCDEVWSGGFKDVALRPLASLVVHQAFQKTHDAIYWSYRLFTCNPQIAALNGSVIGNYVAVLIYNPV